MDKETAIRIIRKPAPCRHEHAYIYWSEYSPTEHKHLLGCQACGSFGFGHDAIASAQESSKKYYEALEYLRSLPEPSAPVDDEFEQIYSEWWHEYDKHYNYMEISQTGFRIVRKGQVILSVLYE